MTPMTIAAEDSGRRVSQRGYLVAYVVIAALAIASYALAHLHLGRAALPLGLAIATVQAVVAALYFMHLVEQRGARRFVLPVCIFFILLLLTLVFADVGQRYPPVRPAGVGHRVPPRPDAPPQAGTPDVRPGEPVR